MGEGKTWVGNELNQGQMGQETRGWGERRVSHLPLWGLLSLERGAWGVRLSVGGWFLGCPQTRQRVFHHPQLLLSRCSVLERGKKFVTQSGKMQEGLKFIGHRQGLKSAGLQLWSHKCTICTYGGCICEYPFPSGNPIDLSLFITNTIFPVLLCNYSCHDRWLYNFLKTLFYFFSPFV